MIFRGDDQERRSGWRSRVEIVSVVRVTDLLGSELRREKTWCDEHARRA